MKLAGVPKMLQFGHGMHEYFESSASFLDKGDVTVANNLLDGQRRNKAARPTLHKVSASVIEITVSFLMFEFTFTITATN